VLSEFQGKNIKYHEFSPLCHFPFALLYFEFAARRGHAGMSMISIDGTENELVMVGIKYEIKYIFYLSHLIFCDSNSAAPSTMYGETYGGRRVVTSLMVAENVAIGFACTVFLIPAISLQRAWSMGASHSRREPQHWQKEGGAAFLQ
jgi:hypothetical protein